uniref:Uncharacterized protein n=1 Tax=Chromera velia CCMP2878 TaxID=1169474 RepID=A0A0G4FSI9_9ALVE|eukprot:Cvel_18554.t1-p1 / transcript=Cvel_18554.t1 / gene=Cvel_18554 / organism=Chromera_velia_CCMP2878 / gene_product=hypothetical protein / transcript_product=hypothetical protein / location=Cvel_scaffold1545:31049-32350(+) / protein_length=434 / sequence_SO=supercontig / SO=protein_coding / is_pseudo=false
MDRLFHFGFKILIVEPPPSDGDKQFSQNGQAGDDPTGKFSTDKNPNGGVALVETFVAMSKPNSYVLRADECDGVTYFRVAYNVQGIVYRLDFIICPAVERYARTVSYLSESAAALVVLLEDFGVQKLNKVDLWITRACSRVVGGPAPGQRPRPFGTVGESRDRNPKQCRVLGFLQTGPLHVLPSGESSEKDAGDEGASADIFGSANSLSDRRMSSEAAAAAAGRLSVDEARLVAQKNGLILLRLVGKPPASENAEEEAEREWQQGEFDGRRGDAGVGAFNFVPQHVVAQGEGYSNARQLVDTLIRLCVVEALPNPPDPLHLLMSNVTLGDKILSDQGYKLALFEDRREGKDALAPHEAPVEGPGRIPVPPFTVHSAPPAGAFLGGEEREMHAGDENSLSEVMGSGSGSAGVGGGKKGASSRAGGAAARSGRLGI